jgi:PAS domain S-box-containing protein
VSLLPKEGAAQRLLVVDDTDASRYATVRVLRNAGFHTEEASTGREALDCDLSKIDLVVLDVNLPDIDGFEVFRALRARKETSNLPIVYLSATFTNDEDIARGMRSGADGYLTHPADPVVLVATVRALLFIKDAHADKRNADARFRALFELAPTGIAMLDLNLAFTDANPALCRLLARSREGLVGQPLGTLLAGGEQSAVAALRVALAQGRNWRGILPLPQPGGIAQTEWQVTRDPATDDCIAIIEDITIRQRIEVAREHALEGEQAARAEAERSNQLKDEFLATLSHELRNPLNAILGWAEVLRKTPELPLPVARGVEAIRRNSKVQAHLISDLLDFAGIRFGKMRLDKRPIDPLQAVDAAVEVVSLEAESKEIAIGVRHLGSAATVLGDEARLQQVFWNLLNNAIKFTPRGGRVDVTTRTDAGSLEIGICDTGAGIRPEFLPRIFDRFSQQDSGSAKNFAGLGIGLTIVRHLVTMHAGTISVTSAGLGRGATFTVRLPVANDGCGGSTIARQRARVLAGLTVLVVEDMEDTRLLVVRLLSDAGATVREAGSAEDAVREVAEHPPDVLVSDIGMPRTDGYQLIRTLRANGYPAERLPAIALTAYTRTEDRSDALEAGFQLHLTKPVSGDVLIAAITNLGARRLQSGQR